LQEVDAARNRPARGVEPGPGHAEIARGLALVHQFLPRAAGHIHHRQPDRLAVQFCERARFAGVDEFDPLRDDRSRLQLAVEIQHARSRRVRRRLQQRILADLLLKPAFDAEQLKQALMNIGINAIEALENGGQVRISGRVLRGDGRDLIPDNASGIRGVEIAFTDTGPGIPPQIMNHLFTPFFTTKKSGTGLGLAIASRIIKAHGGRIEDAGALAYYQTALLEPLAMDLASVQMRVTGAGVESPKGVVFGIKTIAMRPGSIFVDITQDWEAIRLRLVPLVANVVGSLAT
jgi:hypothetical protein